MSGLFNLSIPVPSIPYFFYDPRLARPCNIFIAGLLPPNAHENFEISLANVTNFPRVSIPFHLSIRPNEKAMVRNSWSPENGWSSEERHTRSGFPFLNGPNDGGNFDMKLSVKESGISVLVNGQHEFDYTHRQERKSINMLQIVGNVLIDTIRYEFF